jgi:hypothetical protein
VLAANRFGGVEGKSGEKKKEEKSALHRGEV